jgi:peptide/nickel transport system substrate-binding protein
MYQRTGLWNIALACFFLSAISTYHLTEAKAACPAPTVADAAGIETGKYPHQYELSKFEELTDCKLTFSENPDIGGMNEEINGKSVLIEVAERLPVEPLISMPYNEIGKYGGRLRGTSKSPESGTSDILSLRHVNLFRFHEDLKTVVPCIAKDWQYNEDFTQLTVHLRKGHKWSDGEPFTAEDIAFWYNDIKMNKEYFKNVESQWIFGGKPMQVEAADQTTVKFTFAEPAPNFVTYMAISYRQPFQPKHVLSRFHPKYNQEANKEAKELGFKSWVERFKLYYHDWKDSYHPLSGPKGTRVAIPTLESHVLVKETSEFRRLVANPYFFIVDTAGNQLPYINEHYEIFGEDKAVTILKMINGEIDYKQQALDLDNYPELKQREDKGNYNALLKPAITRDAFYAFNITHKNLEKRKIYGDLRFRQAMSLAMNREQIREIVYLGQGKPMQSLPVDPFAFDFLDPKYITQYTDYYPKQAN